MANISTGTKVIATTFNDLLVRLDNVRKNHLNKDGQNNTANTTFTTAFSTNIAVVGNPTLPSNVQHIKNNLITLANSAWLDTSFAQTITIPSTGALLKANNFNIWDNTITAVENICPNYDKYGKYDKYGDYDDYGKYGDYDKYSDYSRHNESWCFLEGTKILLSDNSTKNIEDIVHGEEILTYNENSLNYCKAIALNKQHFLSPELIIITLENNTQLKTTRSHPILTTEGWACLSPNESKKEHYINNIITLKTGMEAITINGIIKIKNIEILSGNFNVYNITVPQFHTYIAETVVVHNADSKYL